MKYLSWNVNGLRACRAKGDFDALLDREQPDVLCLQETKIQEGQGEAEIPGYYGFWNYAEKKGYSGTGILTRADPLAVRYGLGIEEYDHEGRVITLEFPEWYLITEYVPNAQEELRRIDFRCAWEDSFLRYIRGLDEKKPVIFCGDLNVAHREIDLKNPKSNRGHAGFSDEERGKFSTLLESGFTDTFRYFYPDAADRYSWWSYRMRSREKNVGWRIDYFVVSDRLRPRLQDALIYDRVMGSDHCPVGLLIE